MNRAGRPRATRGQSSIIRTRAQAARLQSRIPSPKKQPLSPTKINMSPRASDDEILLSPSKKRPMSPSFDNGSPIKRVKPLDENGPLEMLTNGEPSATSIEPSLIKDSTQESKQPGIFPIPMPKTPSSIRHVDLLKLPASPHRLPTTPSLIRYPTSLTTIPGSPSKPSENTSTRFPPSRLPRPSSQQFNPSPAKPDPSKVLPTFAPIAVLQPPASNSTPSATGSTTRPSILQRAGTVPTMSSIAKASGSSSIFARRTIRNPHQETQSQLSNLSIALEKLSIPRPASSLGFRAPSTTPATGSLARSVSGPRPAAKIARVGNVHLPPRRPSVPPPRPGTSLGFNRTTVEVQVGKPSVPVNLGPLASRRASAASIALTQSLPEQQVKAPIATTLSASHPPTRSSSRISQYRSAASTSKDSSSSETKPEPAPVKEQKPVATKVALDILKDCSIFVDVRTEDGEDAGGLFVDMLRGLGAKVLVRLSASLTHIVFKSGLPSTLSRFNTLTEPKPVIVGIGWVVECVERRERVDEARFAIAIEDLMTGAPSRRRRSFHSRQLKLFNMTPEDGNEADRSTLSATSETSFVDLPPLEKARRKSLLFAPRIGSPLRTTFNADDEE